MRLLLALAAGLGVLLGLEPFNSAIAGTAAALCMILLAESLTAERLRVVILWSCIVCLSVTLFAFQWIAVALHEIAQISWPWAILLTALQALVLNLKIPFFFLASRVLLRAGLPGILTFPILALAGDLIFYQVFPWFWGNIAGSKVLMQSARLTGVCGISLLLFLQAGCLLEAYRLFRKRAASAKALAAAAAIVTAAYSYGILSLTDDRAPVRIVRAAYIQPVTKPGLNRYRNDDEFAAGALSTVFNLGIKALVDAQGKADILILPESSVPFLGTDESEEDVRAGIYSTTFHAIVAYLSRYGTADVLYNELNMETGQLRNQATLFGMEGVRRSFYNKQHLVPFGEYLPFENTLPLRRLFPEASRYAAAEKPEVLEYRTLEASERRPMRPIASTAELADARLVLRDWPSNPPGLPGRFAPLVCYEGMFPGLVRGFFDRGQIDFFVNIANDTWFGDYLENYQHSGAVRLRAIETGRTVVRITLSGVSTAFSPNGSSLIPESRPGELATGFVEIPVFENVTPYARWGDWPLYGILAVFGAAAAWSQWRKRSR